jgi:lysozyme
MRTAAAGLAGLCELAFVVLLAGCSSPTDGNVCKQSSALRTCASGSVVQGVDVSKYDGTVNWSQAKGAGIVFGFARISDGTANPDMDFAGNWRGMRQNGVVRGAYQYFRASVDPMAQANLVASSLQGAGGLQVGDLPVVMDIETADGQPEATIEAHMKIWLGAVAMQTGRTPIIYTSAGTYPVTTSSFASYPLWVANYGATCPSMPTGWSQWLFWQTSSTGSVNGVGSGNVDLDEFNGSLAQLADLTAGSDSGAAPPPTDASSAAEAGQPRDAGQTTGGVEPHEAGAIGGMGGAANDDGGATVEAGGGGSVMGKAGQSAGALDASTPPCGP